MYMLIRKFIYITGEVYTWGQNRVGQLGVYIHTCIYICIDIYIYVNMYIHIYISYRGGIYMGAEPCWSVRTDTSCKQIGKK
jgi:hypothetical protein